eukprot:TRINITY_DN4230_c0_g1_i1.p1 TRINITY_DN4230_c0_g1~~TRINITY_DN4230_c0_g1_i1.p1  ORF type:complete len:106 (-),score=11.87 TRINITY_DN4230_c0_g1_i1:213-530(-)
MTDPRNPKHFGHHIIGYTGHVSKKWVSKVEPSLLDPKKKVEAPVWLETTAKRDYSHNPIVYGMPGYAGHQPEHWRPHKVIQLGRSQSRPPMREGALGLTGLTLTK